METKPSTSVEADELKRLRDQIKNLKFENNLLKQSQSQQIGLSVEDVSDKPGDHKNIVNQINEEVLNDILDISKEDFSHEETWLYVSSNLGQCSNDDPTGLDLIKWLRHDVDNNRDYEFQVMRRMLVTKIEDLRQGSRRNNIDTRTFTRPKKQMSRPGLRTMVDSPLSEYRELMPQLSESMALCENVDETSMPFNSTYTSSKSVVGVGYDSSVLNANFQKRGECMPSTRFQQVENTRNIFKVAEMRNSGLGRSEDTGLDTIIRKEKSPRLNSTFTKILSEPHLNTTTELRLLSPTLGNLALVQKLASSIPDALNSSFNKVDKPSGLAKPRGYTNNVIQRTIEMNAAFCQADLISSPSANGTFRVPDVRNGPIQMRAASCDSLDDDYSSQSDNSSSANNRLMSDVGDVQNIARLQEESLHMTMSTPRSNLKRNVFDDELPSPIYTRADVNHGYHSDQSDHSSVAKSSRSSQVSSPSGSLRGSTNMLATDVARLGTKLELPKMKPVSAMLTGVRSKSRPMSGLRPPTTRTNQNTVAVSGLPRPTTNIPRALSRIPAPKVR